MNLLNKITTCLFIAVLAMPLISVAQSFEGVVEMTTTEKPDNQSTSVKWYIKNGDNKMVIDATLKDAQASYAVIFKKGQSDGKLLMNTKDGNFAYNIPASQVAGKSQVFIGTSLRRTEGERVIAGFKCYPVKNEKDQLVAWVSEQTGLSLDDLPAAVKNDGAIRALSGAGITGIPMEIMVYDEKGAFVYSQSISSIKPGNVSDSEFDYSGYRSAEDALKDIQK